MGLVDAGEALDELNRLSEEIEHAAILGDSGAPVAATSPADGERLARTAAELLDVAAIVDPARTVEHVHVALPAGAVFVVRTESHVAVATTGPEPTTALVLHDLKDCLERIGRPPATGSSRSRKADAVDA